MPAIDSTTVGYLAPAPPGPEYDNDLQDIFQAFCVGVTGLDGTVVRPRYQPNPPNMLDQSVNWASIGAQVMERQWDAFVQHNPDAASGLGESTVSGSEIIHITFSFYGPLCQSYASILRDGMSVGQNRDQLTAKAIKFVEFMAPVTLPVLLKDTWNRRVDLKGVFNRWVQRTYSIRHLASASGTIDNERYITPWSVLPTTIPLP